MTTRICFLRIPRPAWCAEMGSLATGVAGTPTLVDRYGRVARSLRVSVTDRCNLRCVYCMPEEGIAWFDKSAILTFEEIVRVVGLLTRHGVREVRLTGGEPLLRRELPKLVAMLRALPGIEDLSLTTNGLLLREKIGRAHV